MAVTWPFGRRLIARVFILFYVLAALRGLIPGLCGTLAAFDAAPAQSGAAACCAAMVCAPSDDETPRFAAPAPAHAPCAFCGLVSALAPPADTAQTAVAAAPAWSRLWIVTQAFLKDVFAPDRPCRAPPFRYVRFA